MVGLFIIYALATLPDIVDNYNNIAKRIAEDNKLEKNKLDKEETLSLLKQHAAYSAFYERYPDAIQHYVYEFGGDAAMEISVANFTSGHFLSVFLEYDSSDYNIELDASCDHVESNMFTNVHGAATIPFIQSTQCIEKGLEQRVGKE